MTADQWNRLKDLYHEALSLSGGAQRQAFLNEVLSRDKDLGEELAGLFREADSMPILQTGCSPVEALLTEATQSVPERALAPGAVLADRFRVLRFISSGGMGEVYEAEDLELNVILALKTIRPLIASDPAIVARFRQEIAMARRVSHPNICRVFDLERDHQAGSGELVFLTMELVDGEALCDWLSRNGPPAEAAAGDIASQILGGLDAAHRANVIHGDLKPGNILLVSLGDGSVRAVITDFGLAQPRVLVPDSGESSGAQVAGTPFYMAPEQLRGSPPSIAADLYSIGLVLYELIAVKRLVFDSADAHAGGPFTGDLPGLPQRWEMAIRRCLAPDPDLRPKSPQELLSLLLARDPDLPPARPPRRRAAKIAVSVALLVLCFLIAALVYRQPAQALMIRSIRQITSNIDLASDPSLSRDGAKLAYASDRAEPGNVDIWIQDMPDGTPLRLTSDPAEDDVPSLSPDGAFVAFRSERHGGGAYIVPSTGHQPERLLAPFARNPRVSPDGQNVAYWTGSRDASSASGKIFVIPTGGGVPRFLSPGFLDAREPVWSPDGRYLLFTGCRNSSTPLAMCSEWWITPVNDASAPVSTGALTALRSLAIGVYGPVGGWYSSGVLIAGRRASASSIWRVPISLQTLHLSGAPVQMTSGADHDLSPTLAASGALSFSRLNGALHIWRIRLDDKTAPEIKVTDRPDLDGSPSVSRNGRWLTFVRGVAPRSVWLKDLEGGRETELFSAPLDASSPIVNQEGSAVAFQTVDRNRTLTNLVRPGDRARTVCDGCGTPSGWFDGDRYILYDDVASGGVSNLDILSGEKRALLSKAGVRLENASWSPESQHLLFTAVGDADRRRVYAVKLARGSMLPEGPWISITREAEWCDKPNWSSDGRTVYYMSSCDGSNCVWARHFDPMKHAAVGGPFEIRHYGSARLSPQRTTRAAFNSSAGGNSLFLNLGEANQTIWTGELAHSLFHFGYN